MAALELTQEEAATLVALLSVSAQALRAEYDRDPRPDRLSVWLAVVDLLAKTEDVTGLQADRTQL